MRNRIRDILSLFALINIFINLQAGLFHHDWFYFKFGNQLLTLSAFFFIVQEVIIKLGLKSQLIEVFIEFITVFTIVTLSGLLFKWTTLDTLFYNAWLVVAVYVIAFILRMTSTMKNVMEVNALIKETQDYD